MNTLSDGPRSATGGARSEDALLRAVADMDPGWIVLRDCALADGNQGATARVRYALLHPDIGIALLDPLPGTTTPGAPNRLRALLDAAGFRSAFGDYPPIVYLCVPSRSLFGLNGLLVREFDLQPSLALVGGDAWVGAAQGVLTSEPPLCVPRQAATGTHLPFPIPLVAHGGGAGRLVPRQNLGLRGLAAFWGVVAVAFGGGALVLQSLGPPEGSLAVAHAGGSNRREPEPPPPMLVAPEAWLAPSDSDKTRLPSPSPILARWPGERMPVRFGAGAPEAEDGLAVFDPRVDEDLSVPAAEAAKSAPSPKSSTSTTAGGTSIGRDGAGGVRVAADEASPHPMATGAAAPGTGTPEASTVGSDAGAMATEAETPQWLPRQTQDRIGPAISPDAPALASPEAPEGDAVAAMPPKSREKGAGAAGDPDTAAADPPREAVPSMPAAAQGSSSTASEPKGGPSVQRSTASDDPPASTGTPALTGAGPHPSDATPRAAGLDDAPPPPRLGAAPAEQQAGEPSAAAETPPVGDTAHADPRGARTQEHAAGSAAVVPTDAATPVSRDATQGGEGAAPVPTPAAGARPMEPPAAPGTPVPQTAAVPRAGAAESAAPSAGTPVARPMVQEPHSGAAPAGETERRSPATTTMPPSLVETLVSRGDAMVARRDISAARLLYERAAVAGNARAASALGRTYDPAFLAEIGARGVRGDPALATAWYQKAVSLGDSGALARMEALGGPDSAARRQP